MQISKKVADVATGEKLASHERKIEDINKLMFYVLIVLLLMVAGMVATTGLWVADAFLSKDRKQVIYNVTVTPQQATEMEKKTSR